MKTFILAVLAGLFNVSVFFGAAKEPVVIGLHADMSSGSAKSGEAIRRGALVAISEINNKGGLLGGRKLKLVIKDHHGVPSRSTEQINELAADKNLVAVLGGLHSPAIIQNLPLIHENKIIVVSVWAAATKVVSNGFSPNYVFRVSARDQLVGKFLIDEAIKQGYKNPGLLLEKTAWGRGNEESIKAALAEIGKAPAGVEWFNYAELDYNVQIDNLKRAGADVIILVANAAEGSGIIKTIAGLRKDARIPVISHWGITGGNFVDLVGKNDLSKVNLQFMQTYSFLDKSDGRTVGFVNKYKKMFNAENTKDIFSPVGTAQAYDAVNIIAMAIEKAGTIQRDKVRDALENIESYKGLVKDYEPPFTPAKHEALDSSNFILAAYDKDGNITPVEK